RPRRARLGGDTALALRLLARELAGTANGFRLFAGTLLRRLFVIVAELHLTEDAFALHLLFQRPEGLIDIVIANDDLHASSSPFRVENAGIGENPSLAGAQGFRILDCSNKSAVDCPERAFSALRKKPCCM